jgi:hypothetical protein
MQAQKQSYRDVGHASRDGVTTELTIDDGVGCCRRQETCRNLIKLCGWSLFQGIHRHHDSTCVCYNLQPVFDLKRKL